MYKLDIPAKIQAQIGKLKRIEPIAFKKCTQLLLELANHPRTGTGQVEQLKHLGENIYSRRISKKHRLVYQIHDNIVKVLVISAYGHYSDK